MTDRQHNAHRHTCGHPGPGEKTIMDMALDPFERDALTLMRQIFVAMDRTGSTTSPQAAFLAETLFPPDTAVDLHMALTRLVVAMAQGRSEPFRYSNPQCLNCSQVLTVAERLLSETLHHTRRNRHGHAIVAASLLCDRQPAEVLVAAARQVAMLSPVSPDPAKAEPTVLRFL